MKYGISIVGAGRIGRALGRRLREKGWKIHGVVTTSVATSRRAVRSIGGGHALASITSRILSAKLILIAVPESAIDRVVSDLQSLGSTSLEGKVVLYTSGVLSSDVLLPLRAFGAAVGTIHPLQTFAAVGTPALDGRLFVLEGDGAALRVARLLTRTLGGHVAQLNSSDKPLYHAAAVLACGHVLAVTEAAIQVLTSLGMKRREALKALLPLTRQVLENLERVGPRAAWTGPLARGDYEVIEKHQKALKAASSEALSAYRALNHLAARVLARNPEATLRCLEEIEPNSKTQLKVKGVSA